MSGGIASGSRSGAKPITSVDDSGVERLAVDAKLTSGTVVESNLDYTNDEVTTANTSDGGTTRALTAGDASGRTIVVGAAADGAVLAGNPVLVAGTDGTNAQTIAVNSDGEVGIHDGGNSITVDGSVSISGTVTVDSEMPAAAALADNTANPTTPSVGTFPQWFDGATWDRARGTSADGLLVNLGTNNDVTVTSGSITADTELPAAAALTDNFANPTAPSVASHEMVWDGATWDRAPGNSTDGLLVNLGANNDVTFSGTVSVQGDVAHDGVDSGNPVKTGSKAVAHGTTPTAVAAGDRVDRIANRQGVPFVMGGVPNVKTIEYRWATTDAPSNDDIILVSAGTKIVVTSIMVAIDEACTVGVKVRIGFGTASVPTEPASLATVAGVVFSHGGMIPGSAGGRGDGSGILAIGADDEDLRITATAATSGEAHAIITYYEVAS